MSELPEMDDEPNSVPIPLGTSSLDDLVAQTAAPQHTLIFLAHPDEEFEHFAPVLANFDRTHTEIVLVNGAAHGFATSMRTLGVGSWQEWGWASPHHAAGLRTRMLETLVRSRATTVFVSEDLNFAALIHAAEAYDITLWECATGGFEQNPVVFDTSREQYTELANARLHAYGSSQDFKSVQSYRRKP